MEPIAVIPYLPSRIVSGGQTGVDRAGLDVAIDLGIAHGGWCPAGRISEDGTIPTRYDLKEHESSGYPPRTEQNVIDSDATLILYELRITGGTLLTKRMAQKHKKPHLAARIDRDPVKIVQAWLQAHLPDTLNIAGPRNSTCPMIRDRAVDYLHRVFSNTIVDL